MENGDVAGLDKWACRWDYGPQMKTFKKINNRYDWVESIVKYLDPNAHHWI